MELIKYFEPNNVGRDFVVGDIHGCFSLLSDKLANLGFNTETDRLFSVGDLVDRGPESKQCLHYLDQPWFHAVAGNHEQMIVDVYSGNMDAYVCIMNGGRWFFDLTESQQLVVVSVFMDLPLAIQIGNVGIVHAEVPKNDWNILKEAQEQYDNFQLDVFKSVVLWARDKINSLDDSIVKNIDKVFVGHTPVQNSTVLGNVHYIDTGAVFNGNLTIVEIA